MSDSPSEYLPPAIDHVFTSVNMPAPSEGITAESPLPTPAQTPATAFTISPPVPGTFPERLQTVLSGPYTVNMRRSVQTCVLLEADRCLKMQYRRLKAFQRKVALHDTASDIVDTLTFIPPHYRLEIMYRTATSKVILSPELTWRRMKLIDREIKKSIVPKIMIIGDPTKTHEEICKLYLQKEYEKVSGKKDVYHPNWEYSHDNHFTAYRMFYLGNDINPNLPPALDPNPRRVVPSIRPKPEIIEAENLKRAAKTALDALRASKHTSSPHSHKKQKVGTKSAEKATVSSKVPTTQEKTERRALLKEIKDHLDILKEMKGIIPDKDLNARKKALFARLPKP